jgi:trigger factor
MRWGVTRGASRFLATRETHSIESRSTLEPMNVKVNASGAWQHTLEVEVPAEEVEARLDEVARTIQRRAALPGFRKGHVPLPLVRQNFAETVEQEFLESYLPRVTGQALAEVKLDPVVPPQVRNLRMVPGQPMRFQAVVEVRPEVEAKDFQGIPVTRRTQAVAEPDVDRMMDRLRQDAAVFVDLDRPAGRGDVVVADSVRLDANGRRMPSTRAKNLRLELGAPDMLPDLENGLLGAEAGQERTVEIAYPADYPSQDLAGRSIRYLIRVRKTQEKKLRDLDDNFAREVFGLTSLEELRERVRHNLEGEEAERTRREVEDVVVDELIRRNPFDLPERLVQWTLERMIHEAAGHRPIQDDARAQLEQRYRPPVERTLRREILLGAVARQERLEVNEEEIAAEIERMVQSDPRQAARVRARYQAPERRRALGEALLERKAMDRLLAAAKVNEEMAGGRVVPVGR